MKATSRTVRLNQAQLEGLLVAASTAADQATRDAAEHPDRRDRLRADAANYRRLATLLRGAVAAEVTVWVAEG
jgi:hypothetical protein